MEPAHAACCVLSSPACLWPQGFVGVLVRRHTFTSLAASPAASCVVEGQASVLAGPHPEAARTNHLLSAEATPAQRPHHSHLSGNEKDGSCVRNRGPRPHGYCYCVHSRTEATGHSCWLACPCPASPLSGEETEAAVTKVTFGCVGTIVQYSSVSV